MGTCQSQQQAVTVDGNNCRIRKVGDLNHSLVSYDGTHSTTGTTDSPTIHHGGTDHARTGSTTMLIISEDISFREGDTVTAVAKQHHVLKKSSGGIVKDYLQVEGPSCNRSMVHIESSIFGLPIEKVYDGVHDGEVLGEGVGGKVRLITHRETGIERAVKCLDLDRVGDAGDDGDDDDADLNRLLDEIKIMCCLDHPTIVCLEEVFEGENCLYLTQELCEGGDLFDRLDEQPNYHYNEDGAAKIIKQIISAVSYLHSKDIIHRDLKLENFLFMNRSKVIRPNGEEFSDTLKMIDFGLSKHFVQGELQHDQVGTPYSVAPEVILDKETGLGYDEKCDVWSIGVLTYLLLSGFTPFGGDCGENPKEMLLVAQRILSGHVSFDDTVWDCVSTAAIDFIRSMLVLSPEDRPRAAELGNHPWMKMMKRNSSIGSDESSSISPNVVNSIVSMRQLGKTQAFLREIISFTLQPNQISGLREEFEKIDLDGSGEISLSCFRDALVASSELHSLSEEEIEQIFQSLKVRNTDMCIRWHEFIAACLSQCHIDNRNIRLAFEKLDTDHKGYITLEDLKKAISFYGGSDSRYDLHKTWINSILDYESDKDIMNYDDFYKLLKLQDTGVICNTPLKRRNSSLSRSCFNNGDNSTEIEFRHSMGPLLNDVDFNEEGKGGSVVPNKGRRRRTTVIDNIRQSRDAHDFLCQDEKQGVKSKKKIRRVTMSGNGGLLMCRDSLDKSALMRTNT